MSTTSPHASRRDIELELGSELNALLSASRALTERSAVSFHPSLRPAAFHVARWLYAFGPAKPSAIARAVGMDRSSTSGLIGQLRELDLVATEPDPADSRGVIVSLTDPGRVRVAKALDVRGSEFFERTDGWSSDDLSTLVDLLRRFNSAKPQDR